MLEVNDKIEVIKPFPNGNLTGKKGIVVELSMFRKPVLYVEIEGKRIACLPEYLKKL
jgi:hypothetical protein